MEHHSEYFEAIIDAAACISESSFCIAFTGAGISVESGIPPFRGENGIWNRYDPRLFDIRYFHEEPELAWKGIRDIFFDFIEVRQPNEAHKALASMEKEGYLRLVVTQNIDNLHFKAGSVNVVEFHGNTRDLVCIRCGEKIAASPEILAVIPPHCGSCGGLLKPDFVFFGEPIPQDASERAFGAASRTDCIVIVGTTGAVHPAALIPEMAKRNGARVIEINPEPSEYTYRTTDIFVREKAGKALSDIVRKVLSRESPPNRPVLP